MKNLYKTIALAGANLLVFTANANEATPLQPVVSHDSNHNQVMTDGQMRAIEASNLRVPGMCKWGHAAFDPIEVGNEIPPAEVTALHGQVDMT